ncbi:MAG: hypothetical protein BGO76_03045 [Caedibacter sp. 38-128]|nr:hypothetical protein [Holosporales bacterium]OJX08250.1 MAG: hypothetical protein BGO76_03045 [Caedibacter sp. 38-128]
MNNINQVRKKIELLKKKEAEMVTRDALKLYRKCHQILGEEYSPELVAGLITHAWENKSPKLKEVWLQKATSFRSPQVAPQPN